MLTDGWTDGLTDGRTENRTPISHPATSRCDKNHKVLKSVKTMYKLSKTRLSGTQSHLHICMGSISVAQGSDILLSSDFPICVFLIQFTDKLVSLLLSF